MLLELKKLPKSNRRVGRGIGSKKGGHTVGYGTNGQGVRGKGKVAPGFEGGNIPTYRKIPTLKGFKSLTTKPVVVTLSWLAKNTKKGDVVDMAFLSTKFDTRDFVRIIGSAEIKHEITVKGIYVTAGAKAIIEKAGGKIEQ